MMPRHCPPFVFHLSAGCVHNTMIKYASAVSTPPVSLSSPFHPWPSRKLDQSQVKLSVLTASHAIFKHQGSLTSQECLSQIIIHTVDKWQKYRQWWKQGCMNIKPSVTCVDLTLCCSAEWTWLILTFVWCIFNQLCPFAPDNSYLYHMLHKLKEHALKIY